MGTLFIDEPGHQEAQGNQDLQASHQEEDRRQEGTTQEGRRQEGTAQEGRHQEGRRQGNHQENHAASAKEGLRFFRSVTIVENTLFIWKREHFAVVKLTTFNWTSPVLVDGWARCSTLRFH